MPAGLRAFEVQDRRHLLQFPGHAPHADGSVMGGPGVRIPPVPELPRTAAKAMAAVGNADLHDRVGDGMVLGAQQRELLGPFHNRLPRDRAVPDRHFHGNTLTDLPMVDLQTVYLDRPFRNRDMTGAVVRLEHDVVRMIHGVVLGE